MSLEVNLQAASMSCLAMFQNVAFRAFEMKLKLADESVESGVGIWKGVIRSWVSTRRDFAPFRCFAHSETEVSKNS